MTISATDFYSAADGTMTPEVEAAFYRTLKMRNSTFKTTHYGRFDDINPALAKTVGGRIPPDPQILDLAVSTGVSTVELANALRSAGMVPQITATDLYIEGRIFDLGGGMRVLADRLGWPLQYDVRGLAIRPWIRRLDYVTLAFLPRQAVRAALVPKLRAMAQSAAGEWVSLVSRKLADDPAVRLIEDDLFVRNSEFVGRFDLIRAANILNSGYFTNDVLLGGIGNIRSYLRGSGSLLLVTRTADADNRNAATLFELAPNGKFRVVDRFAEGSEIEALVLGS